MKYEKEKIIRDLNDFLNGLREYLLLDSKIVRKCQSRTRVYKKEWDSLSQQRESLQIKQGELEHIIELISNTPRSDLHFSVALAVPALFGHKFRHDAILQATQLIRSTIGRLNILSNEEINEILDKKAKLGVSPKVFVAHGGKSKHLTKLTLFLEALGMKPLVAEIEPSRGRLTEQQVNEIMAKADCAIILANFGHILDIKSGKRHPRLNVVDELGRCREKFPNKTILLLEKGVDLSSNDSAIIYEYFTKTNMENALIKVAKELKNFGLI